MHPAYTDPTLATSRLRVIWNSGFEPGDPAKASRALWDLAVQVDPPFYLALGKDAVALIRKKTGELQEEVDKFESWSDDLAMA